MKTLTKGKPLLRLYQINPANLRDLPQCPYPTTCTHANVNIICNSLNCVNPQCSNRTGSPPIVSSLTIDVLPAGTKGLGGFAKRQLHIGDPICHYTGEIIPTLSYHLRQKHLMDHYPDELEKSYTMDFDSQHKICARYYGNYSRFINHSCKPNCFVIPKELYGSKVYIVYANASISPGEELTINNRKKSFICLCSHCCASHSSQRTFLSQSVINKSTIYSQSCTSNLALMHRKKLPLSLLVFLDFLITSIITQTPHTSPRLFRPTSPAYK